MTKSIKEISNQMEGHKDKEEKITKSKENNLSTMMNLKMMRLVQLRIKKLKNPNISATQRKIMGRFRIN